MKSKIPELLNTDPRVSVGRFTYGKPKFMLWAENETVSIGAFCSIADDVTIFGGGEHNTQWNTTYPLRIAFGLPGEGSDGHPSTKGPTIIGNDVWIGFGATILSGSQVGNGAVIGARAVVSGKVPAFSIFAGNPARVVRQRFELARINELQKMKWWDWPVELIKQAAPYLCSSDTSNLIEFAKTHGISIPD